MPINNILYINLERRRDRNDNMISLLNKLKLNDISKRVNAVDGKMLTRDNISSDDVTNEGIDDAFNDNQMVYTFLTSGAVGCALSHKKCYQYIVDNNISQCLILEDDVRIDPDFVNKFNEIEKEIPKDFDIFVLGYSSSQPLLEHNDLVKNYKLFHKTKRFYGLFGYIVSNKGAKKLLKLFPITKQIDSEISKNLDHIDAYALNRKYCLITSDLSEKVNSIFGTDTQVRNGSQGQNIENFFENDDDDGSYWIILIIIFVGLFVYWYNFIHE